MIIHVNSHKIRNNRQKVEKDPPVAVRKARSAKAFYFNKVEILDKMGEMVAEVLYTPEHPLKCCAEVYISTKYQVREYSD